MSAKAMHHQLEMTGVGDVRAQGWANISKKKWRLFYRCDRQKMANNLVRHLNVKTCIHTFRSWLCIMASTGKNECSL